ncbi:WYL domain-containing protein [Desulfovibrio sp. OttesenSCG-928-M14]|nr:WYL domain-containing protein [Desulfovibrio sp. OttesenSCG-928-M14]
MDTIETSGVAEIETGIEKGRRWYQLKNLPGTPHIGLTGAEVENLALCRDLLERLLPDGIEKVIAESINKISTLMEKAENRAEATSSKAVRSPWGRIDYAPFQDRMETLLRAIPDHRVCIVEYRELEYRIDKEGVQLYEFVPVRLATEDDALNMEGWLVTDKGTPEAVHPLTLAVHRVISCAPTRRILQQCPPLPEHQGAFGLLGYGAFPVRVSFSEEYSGFIRERFWSEGQEIIELEDGEIELRFMAADEYELLGWVLSFGNGAELIEPEGLRRELFEEIQDLWDMYAEEDDKE